MKYDIFGIENPLIDLLASVPDGFLTSLAIEKNKMFLVDLDRFQSLVNALQSVKVIPEPGGSCANTVLGVAQLGGKAAFAGKVGGDDYGRIYIEKLEKAGVASFVKADGHLTGSTVILVTPDAARTMNTFLGACQELGPQDIPLEEIRQSKQLYITGYLWDTDGQKEAALLALKTAKKAGIPVAMSLSDPFCVNRHHDDFLKILDEYVDLVFANEEEALALSGQSHPHHAMEELAKLCQGAVVTLGSKGALVREGKETVYINPFPVEAVDTTGAGDAFAAGFLYGRAHQASLFKSGRLGAFFASQVIIKMGPRLDGDVKKLFKPLLDNPTP